jgi:hypothetical protein
MTISVTRPAAVLPTRATLQEQTAIIVNPHSSYGDLFQAVATLYTWFSTITAVREDTAHPEKYRDTFASSGKLISPLGAARCMGDAMRTARFLQGVHAAILEAQQRFPGQCLELLYAGSGPFATLVLPILPLFSPDQLRVTVIDIHQESLDAVTGLLAHFGLTESINALVLDDATSYHHPAGQLFHLLVTETMQKALAQEPQVAITLHLVKQLHERGLLVPERITVRACLADLSKEFAFVDAAGGSLLERARVELGTLIDVSVTSARTPTQLLTPITVHIPLDADPAVRSLILCTHITTFGAHELDDYDSGLTYPTTMPLDEIVGGTTITFTYILDSQPGFRMITHGPSA